MVPASLLERLPRTKRNLALLVIGVLLALFLWSIRAVVNPLLLGYLFAFILHPLVERLHRLGLSRRTAANTIFVLGFLLLVGATFGLVVQARNLGREVFEDPDVQRRLRDQFQGVRELLSSWLGPQWVRDLDLSSIGALLRQLYQEHADAVQAAGQASLTAVGTTLRVAASLLGGVFALASAILLVPLYTYYLLFELDRIHSFVRRHLPLADRERMAEAGQKMGDVVASFFRGRLFVCALKGVFLWGALWVAGVPYAFLFGIVSGFLSLIPFFGPFVGYVLATVVGVLDHGLLGSLVRTSLVFGVAELLEGYVLIPKVLGNSLGLHPVVVLFAIFAGGAALGMLGVLIALPLTAALVILAQDFVLPALRRSVDES